MTLMTLQARAVQATAFSPRLQQAVRLLQMSSMEYTQALRDAAEANPFLEIEDAPPPSTDSADAVGPGGADWEIGFGMSAVSASPSAQQLSHDDSFDVLQQVPLPSSLRSHLHSQLGVLRLSERERAFACAVVEALDDDGYLRVSMEELNAALGEYGDEADAELRTALRRVQALEPAGVAARSVQECLGLQIGDPCQDDDLRQLARRIVENHIDVLAGRDLQKLARAVGRPLKEVHAAVECIRRLEARPGWRFGDNTARAVTPDVTVRKVRGVWKTSLNTAALPRVQLHKAYAALFEQHRGGDNAEMKGCLEQARWTVRNLSQRVSTILDVSRAIVARQKMFLEYGPLAMKPLGLREIADAVGVHPSTVSRTVHNKYMATPAGVFELQYFFSRGLDHSAGGASAPIALRELIRELIAAEPSNAPLSDAALARELAQQGFNIARRTVTKYRQSMHIEPVERRRMQGALAA